MKYERSKAVVLRAVPQGCRLARHVAAWKRAALAHPALELMRADGRSNMAALIEVISLQQDPASRTWRTTWAWVAERLGVHEDSIGRMIRRLKDWGLLAVVATGRSAARTPRSTGRTQGEAPVYALTVHAPPPAPAPETAEAAAEAVDINVGPVPPEGVCSPPHAREEFSPTDAATPRRSAKRAAQRREVVAALSRRTAPLWPAHATVKPSRVGATRRDWKQAYRLAALELQHHAIVLRQITTAHVAARLRVFFEAGWSVHDVLTALDWTPHGTRYPYSGGDYVQNPGAWLAHRLRAWLHHDGTPRRSPGQRAAAEAEQRRAQAIAAAARAATRPTPAPDAGPRDPRPFRQRWAAQIAAGQAARRLP
ncbi:hypothetical protein [Kocuria flava]|uniref:hypothetical protein n=1 Tax=Kocuria flava TaxID=446860 RepID=UPI0015DDCA24|nr:hypothetical protein [Kocuria flava]